MKKKFLIEYTTSRSSATYELIVDAIDQFEAQQIAIQILGTYLDPCIIQDIKLIGKEDEYGKK